jgi:hypothetical protein
MGNFSVPEDRLHQKPALGYHNGRPFHRMPLSFGNSTSSARMQGASTLYEISVVRDEFTEILKDLTTWTAGLLRRLAGEARVESATD